MASQKKSKSKIHILPIYEQTDLRTAIVGLTDVMYEWSLKYK